MNSSIFLRTGVLLAVIAGVAACGRFDGRHLVVEAFEVTDAIERVELRGAVAHVELSVGTGRHGSAQRKELITTLREQAELLRRQQDLVAEQARLLERARIARDVHDAVGNQLCVISVLASGLEVDGGLGPAQRDAVRQLRTTAHGAPQDLRTIVGILSSPSTVESTVDFAGLVRRSAAAGMAVRLSTVGDRPRWGPGRPRRRTGWCRRG